MPNLQREVIQGFLGVNLRRDGLTLADGELARAINAELRTRPGVLLRRRGRTLESPTALAGAIRHIARHNAHLYHLAGDQWYRNKVSILSGLNQDGIQTMAVYQVPNATSVFTYLAGQTTMQKDAGAESDIPAVRQWGLSPPTAAPTVSAGPAGSLNGEYKAAYTYRRGSVLESNPSPTSASVTLTNQQLNVTVVASTDPQVTNIGLYRTVERGAVLLFDRAVANASATVTSILADGALGIEAPKNNQRPPLAGWVTEFQGAFWLCRDPKNPDHLHYSQRFFVEYWPPDQFLKIGNPSDALQCAVPQVGFLGVFTRLTKYRVFGSHAAGYTYLEALNTRGTAAPQAVLSTSRGVLFWARDGLFLTNFVAPDQELSMAWAPLFDHQRLNEYAPIDWSMVHTFSLTRYKSRLYAGYTDTDGHGVLAVFAEETGQWYFYENTQRTLYYDESTEQLLAGTNEGLVYVLEDGDTDDGAVIVMQAHLAVRAGGDRFVQKQFQYLRIDVHSYEPTQVELYIDTVIALQMTITSARDRRLYRLPAGLMGYTWQVRLRGSFDLYAVQIAYLPMEATG